jgi:hypothetical protein
MKTRISAMIVLLCVVGFSQSVRADDELPTISSGTIEPYMSFMAGIAVPFSEDATFRNGDVDKNVDYQNKQSIGGNAGVWFPTRNALAGFDLGVEIAGFVWFPDVACCREGFNGQTDGNGEFQGTTTEIQGIYVGGNFLVRRPFGISEAYPNGRWHPYAGVGIGAHQLAFRPGGTRGATFASPLIDQRDTAPAFQALGGLKAHLFKYVAVFAEAKYIHAYHDELGTDRFGQSGNLFAGTGLFLDQYESTIRTIFVHAGLSVHFDVRP